MEDLTSKTVAVFARPFTVPGFNETLPAGSTRSKRSWFHPRIERIPQPGRPPFW
jgi:hypothetical protein